MLAPPHRSRPGLTLLEVIVSLAIFLMSLGAIFHLMSFAQDEVIKARLNQHAAFLCQSKLNELVGGSLPLDSSSESSFEDGGLTWNWSLDCSRYEQVPNLWLAKVTVYRDAGYGQQVKVTVTKMLLDPSARGSTFDLPPASNNEPSSSSSSGGN